MSETTRSAGIVCPSTVTPVAFPSSTFTESTFELSDILPSFASMTLARASTTPLRRRQSRAVL
jgi:hypothetical protein